MPEQQEGMWLYLQEPGIEHLKLTGEDGWLWADGFILTVINQLPTRLHYLVRFDQLWQVRGLRLEVSAQRSWVVERRVDDDWQWMEYFEPPEPKLAGCRDFDISFSVATKSLIARKAKLGIAETTEVSAAFLDRADLRLKFARCRYTCLQRDAEGRLYRYENLYNGETLEFRLEESGLLIDSDGVLKRVW